MQARVRVASATREGRAGGKWPRQSRRCCANVGERRLRDGTDSISY
jgi:hypothetical protein